MVTATERASPAVMEALPVVAAAVAAAAPVSAMSDPTGAMETSVVVVVLVVRAVETLF